MAEQSLQRRTHLSQLQLQIVELFILDRQLLFKRRSIGLSSGLCGGASQFIPDVLGLLDKLFQILTTSLIDCQPPQYLLLRVL